MSKAKTGTIFHWGEGEQPPLTQVVSELQKVGLLPNQQSWWFAWKEVEIELPGALRDINALPTNWDALHIFSPYAEFRQIRRGQSYQWLLLTEEELPNELVKPRSQKPPEQKKEKVGLFGQVKSVIVGSKSKLNTSSEKKELSPHSWVKSKQSYPTMPSHRIMWGNRLKKGSHSGVEEARGVVEFPRPLEYDVADEETGNYDKALVADVRLYFDDEARLQTVRYMRIRHLPPGHHSVSVQPFKK